MLDTKCGVRDEISFKIRTESWSLRSQSLQRLRTTLILESWDTLPVAKNFFVRFLR